MVKKIKRTVEIPSIEITITFDEKFYDDILEAKVSAEEETGRDIPLGEFIMRSMDGCMDKVEKLEEECQKQNKIIEMFMGIVKAGGSENMEEDEPEVTNSPADMYH